MTPHLLPGLTHITYANMSTRVSQNAPKCEFSKTVLGITVSIPKSHPKKISRVLRHFWQAAIIFTDCANIQRKLGKIGLFFSKILILVITFYRKQMFTRRLHSGATILKASDMINP